MVFVAFSNPMALVLWIAVYILGALCFIVKRGAYAFSLVCGAVIIAAITVTLVAGAELIEIGVELAVFAVLCLVLQRFGR